MVFSITEFAIWFIQTVMIAIGVPGLFLLMVVESTGIPPLPSELILPFSGILMAQGATGFLGIPFDWLTVMVAALAGTLVGAVIAYEIGSRIGMPFIKHIGKKISIDEKDFEKAERFFERRGEATVAISRLLPIVRAYISYPAGAAKMERHRFSVFTIAGAFPFTLALVYAGYVLGENLSALAPFFTFLDVIAVSGIVLFLVLFYLRKQRQIREAQAAKA